MFSFFKKKENKPLEDVIPDPDIDFSDSEELDEEQDVPTQIIQLIEVIPKNLLKESFSLALSQINTLESLISGEPDLPERVLEKAKEFLNSEVVTRARADEKHLNFYLSNVEDFSEGWETYSKSKNTTVYLKKDFEEDVTSLTFAGESIINTNLLFPCCVMAEHELLPDWVPWLKSVDLLHERSPLKKLIHIKVDLFMPFKNRDLVTEGTGFVLKEDKAVCFIMKSDNSGEFYGTEFDDQCEGRVRLDLKHGFMHMQYLDENTCKFKVIMNVDMKLSLGQGWVGKMVMNKVVKTWINKIVTQSESLPGSKFAPRLIKNPVYRYLAKELDLEFPEKDDVLTAN